MNTKSYFFQSFAIVALAFIAFIGFKQILPDKIFSESKMNSKNVLIDSLLLEAVAKDSLNETTDSIDAIDDAQGKEKITFDATEGIEFPAETFDNYKGYQYLISFYEKLYQLEKNPESHVRIAYYGDSMTDGDLIVQDVRSNYQERFGGNGVGFVSITSESAASRGSIKSVYSKNWKTQSYLNVKKPISPFGVNGHVFFANDIKNTTWVQYEAGTAKNVATLDNPTLFYGRASKKGKVNFIIGKDTIHKNLVPNNLINTLKVSSGSLKAFKANFVNADSIPIYGFNFDNGKGVHVDNFSQRGNSGLPISMFNANVMQSFNNSLKYDLIILHYGTNVLNYGTKNYSWYERGMTKAVDKIKESFPGVSILIISTADKSTKYDLEMKSDSAVVPLMKAQKKYALDTESGFVNLYTLMGGDGSMVKWVDETPARANKDYTHFNQRGAKAIGKLVYDQLNKGYEEYKKLREKREVASTKQRAARKINTDSVSVKNDTVNE
ncbi:SGNH/GDSL hydrolase family protein [Flavobacterium sp. JLP]|uniref:SGNH/GDSL hydrolase family protein n=1 Tax=unclassified Flavobacterium TaxID=196869 RepID=UPI00188AB601|nr:MULTISPECIES: SGNH/GDSL hydrolase family protein [unclassified Flavobacterium]MBF4492818.1 SGNH/GDSL hydrolase family protein [Flavobacterium sp. MR2016-29]MBF4507074.1 SGNH/GDSL hydrolase family protein [Flavobacterium sp. JLP]